MLRKLSKKIPFVGAVLLGAISLNNTANATVTCYDPLTTNTVACVYSQYFDAWAAKAGDNLVQQLFYAGGTFFGAEGEIATIDSGYVPSSLTGNAALQVYSFDGFLGDLTPDDCSVLVTITQPEEIVKVFSIQANLADRSKPSAVCYSDDLGDLANQITPVRLLYVNGGQTGPVV